MTYAITDDYEPFGQLMRAVMERRGFKAVYFDTPEETLESLTPEFNGLLSDMAFVTSPMISLDFIKAVRSKMGAEFTIVATSGEDSYDWRNKALEAGANSFLAKPFSNDVLIENLARPWIAQAKRKVARAMSFDELFEDVSPDELRRDL